MSQVSSAAAATSDDEVQISSGSEGSKTEVEAQTDEALRTSPTPSTGDSSHGVNERKKKSEIWKHFKDAEEGFIRCVYCRKQYKVVHGGTTSHLWRHLGSCGLYKRAKGKTAGLITISEQDDNEVVSPVWVNGKWDPMKDRELLAKMIVGHELPFLFSEYSIFHSYMKYNNPLWQKVSRITITRDSNFEWVPDEVEWEKAKKVSKLLMIFSETTKYFQELLIPPQICF
jgi:BED zinc finger